MANETRGAFTDWQARKSANGGVPQGGEGQFTDVYTFTTPDDSRPTVTKVHGLPAMDEEQVPGYKVHEINFRQDDPRSHVWFAEVVHRKKSSAAKAEGDNDSTIVRRTWGARQMSVDFTVDALGRMVRNTAGDPFESVPTVSRTLPTITVERKERTSPASKIAEYSGTVNDSSETVCGITILPHCGRITITGEDSDDEDYPYAVTYAIETTTNPIDDGETTLLLPSGVTYGTRDGHPDIGFDHALLNVGYYYNYGEGKLRFYDNPSSTGVAADGTKDGGSAIDIDPSLLQPSTVPMPLGGSGDDRREYGDTYTTVFVSHPATDWGGLKLPN